MSRRFAVCTASPLLGLVIRRTLARSRLLENAGERRDAGAAAAALGDDDCLAVVDAELLCDAVDGAPLRKLLITRRGSAVVVDARGVGVAREVAAAPSVTVLRGRVPGGLDLDAVEEELLATVGRALQRRVEDGGAAAGSVDLAAPYEGVLDLIVLGVSTGGPTLLLQLLSRLTAPAVPLLVVQHMPESETPGFAARLGEQSGLPVWEVRSGPLPAPGAIGVVRGGHDFHLVRREGALRLRDTVLAGNPFHPNIDAILTSAVDAGVAVGAAVLTGMGQDGSAGALAMARKGLPVVAQRPDTCAVAGMPQAAIDNGAARWVQSPERIAVTLNAWSDAARAAEARCRP